MRQDSGAGFNGGNGTASCTAEKPKLLPTTKANTFAHYKPEPIEFVDGHGLFLADDLNFLTGAGAIGKSLTSLQLACAVALPERDYPETHWLGRPVRRRGKVLYVSAEDELKVNHSRVLDIAAAEAFETRLLYNLEICDLSTKEDKALFTGQKSHVRATPLFTLLENTIRALHPALVVLDNRTQLADVDELNRNAAAKVGNYLRALSKHHDTTLIVLAHPSLSGLSQKTGNSGSTGWITTIRNQVDMRKPDDAEAGPDDGRRILVSQKPNYGPQGRVVNMKWDMGAYRCTDEPKRAGSDIGRPDKARRVFMRLLQTHNSQNLFVSARPSSSSFAPKVFYSHPQNENVSLKELKTAMHVLLNEGQIANVAYGPPSKRQYRLEVVKCNL
ncbi:AAA family ATPase [Sinorhizobium meliloti]|nr:AAA family ATPase [Sinorhizobium meliloti]MDW9656540.1 AAA family ATPase [Sinorhizobium meliloti]MDW9916350.1 AAA family ATPase [Sinorhizobium meliloti]MDW9939661.1 AAA family ATPase [Sinorhizobium meliloti]MDW9945882.1 AAA family ATPase [Sinorhizobium meliloti]